MFDSTSKPALSRHLKYLAPWPALALRFAPAMFMMKMMGISRLFDMYEGQI